MCSRIGVLGFPGYHLYLPREPAPVFTGFQLACASVAIQASVNGRGKPNPEK